MAWLTTPIPWNYRKLKYINNTSGTALSGYQMKFTIHQGGGIDTATDVYLGGNANADLSDVRFTDNSGTTLLNYWFESNSGGIANVWIKVPSIPIGSPATYIYIYYGNSSQTINASNGTNTFIVFDDFTNNVMTNWNQIQGTSYFVVQNYRMEHTTGFNPYPYWGATVKGSTTSNTPKFVMEYTANTLSTSGCRRGYGWMIYSDSSHYFGWCNVGGPGCGNARQSAGYSISINQDTLFTPGTEKKVQVIYDGTRIRTYFDGTLYWDASVTLAQNNRFGFYVQESGNGSENPEYWDNLLIRNYISPEPTWQIANTQETYTINLTVSSIPSGAEIYLNGGDTFKTTTDFFTLYPGIYDVLLKKVGYQDWWSGYFTIDPNNPSQQQFGYVVTGNLVSAQITATDLSLDKTTCQNSCTVVATITWNNPGPKASFEPAVTVDGIRNGSGSTISLDNGGSYQRSFTIPLGLGTHTVCPDPN